MEITLAAVIGAVIVLACLGVFSAMDGVDRALARKLDETAEMARLHLVMRRTFSTLVMSDQPQPRAATATGAGGTGGPASSSGASGASGASGRSGSSAGSRSSGSSSSTSAADAARSGFSASAGLGSSSSSSSSSTSSRAGSSSGSTGGRTGASTADSPGTTADTSTPADRQERPHGRFIIDASPVTAAAPGGSRAQRLEVVLQKPPLADPRAMFIPVITQTPAATRTTASSARAGASATSATAGSSSKTGTSSTTAGLPGGSSTATTTGGTTSGAGSGAEGAGGDSSASGTTGEPLGVRGFFDLVPESTLPDYRPRPRLGRPEEPGYALVWRALPAVGVSDETAQAVLAAEPIVVARGLAACRWRAFDDRERKDIFNAVWDRELPAYVEMEVRTVSGLYANWLFEVEWNYGPEPGEAPAAARGGGGGGGGPGAGGGGGGQRRPGVARPPGSGPRVEPDRIRRPGAGRAGPQGGPGVAPERRWMRDGPGGGPGGAQPMPAQTVPDRGGRPQQAQPRPRTRRPEGRR